MKEVQLEAIEKLRAKEQEIGVNSRYARAVFGAVRDAMIGFCEQQAELADAVFQQEKTLGECCEQIMKGCGNSISDIEVYAKAVAFYFPGAKVEMKMTVYMSEYERDEKQAVANKPGAKIFDLKFEDLFGRL